MKGRGMIILILAWTKRGSIKGKVKGFLDSGSVWYFDRKYITEETKFEKQKKSSFGAALVILKSQTDFFFFNLGDLKAFAADPVP